MCHYNISCDKFRKKYYEKDNTCMLVIDFRCGKPTS